MRQFILKCFEMLLDTFHKPQVRFASASGNESPIALGEFAAALLKNPAFDAAIKKIENRITLDWKLCAGQDKDKREHHYYQMQALAEIQVVLRGMVNNMLIEESRKNEQK